MCFFIQQFAISSIHEYKFLIAPPLFHLFPSMVFAKPHFSMFLSLVCLFLPLVLSRCLLSYLSASCPIPLPLALSFCHFSYLSVSCLSIPPSCPIFLPLVLSLCLFSYLSLQSVLMSINIKISLQGGLQKMSNLGF